MSDLGNKEIFAKNLRYYMNYYEKDRISICDELHIPYTTFADWHNGITYPRIDKIEMLANYFNIKKSDLIENKYKDEVPDELEVLFHKYKNLLSDDDRETIKFIIERARKKHEEEQKSSK